MSAPTYRTTQALAEYLDALLHRPVPCVADLQHLEYAMDNEERDLAIGESDELLADEHYAR